MNGRDDFTVAIDSSQLPMFRLLGTPEQDKRRMLYDGGHVFPFARVEKDTLRRAIRGSCSMSSSRSRSRRA